MKSFLFLFINFIGCLLFLQTADAARIFYNKAQLIRDLETERDPEFKGCTEPTEPFNCPGSETCISLQFICDGIPGDCPMNYDEDPNLCNAYERPPKDTIVRFLSTQYSNHGNSFITYLFGNNAALMFKKIPAIDAFGVIASNLAISPTISEFAKNMEMTHVEKQRLFTTLKKVNTGQVNSLPAFIRDSINEGLSSLVDNLKKTNFINI